MVPDAGQDTRGGREPDGQEAPLTLLALGCGTGVVPRLVWEHSAVRDRLAVLPGAAGTVRDRGVRTAGLRQPLVAALWSLCR
ncbi:type 2 periplasmic-binding domain-containing protein [Streptomyces cellulosae]|uniref:hypothetical protein n=1 Tax=Streptomyces cellulosae TaxID=1968 RepID=UPI0004C7150C|nr:hypothetical protein [Streptomyces cellulosae]